jgi:hypothetical protein
MEQAMKLDLLLYAQAVAPEGSRASRVLAKAIKELDAGKQLTEEFIVNIKSCIKKIQYYDRGLLLEKTVKEWNAQ